MNDSSRDAHRGRPPRLAVQLDDVASALVRRYSAVTGCQPRDAVNGAVTSDIGPVVEQLESGEPKDDGPDLTAAHVQASVERRQTGNNDVPLHLRPLTPEEVPYEHNGNGEQANGTAKRHRITLDLSSRAYHLLDAHAHDCGFASPEAAALSAVAGNVYATLESLKEKDVHSIFETELGGEDQD